MSSRMSTLFLSTLFLSIVRGQNPTSTSTIWINEFHYDNTGTDQGEFVEIAGISGIGLSDYSIYLYNGATQVVYTADVPFLDATIPNQENNYGTSVISFPSNGIQNGAPDGIALVYQETDVVQFISYEGSFTATDGPAAGMTSTDIGVSQNSDTPTGASLSLIGTGNTYNDFIWVASVTGTPGQINDDQNMINIGTPQNPTSTATIVTGQDPTSTSTIWINEFHYDNTGTDQGEFVEIAGISGISLSDYSIYLYNGNTQVVYDGDVSFPDATIPNQENNYGTSVISFPSNGIQNGAPDGIALVYQGTDVVQFISYEGSFTAIDGPAVGMTSTDIGVSQNIDTPTGASLSLIGTGNAYNDFIWDTSVTGTPGQINDDQNMINIVRPQNPTSTSTIWINEFHYDNTGTDEGEFVEIAGISGIRLSDYSIYLYNGATQVVYTADVPFPDATIPNQENNYGTSVISFPSNGIQNGEPDGIALVYQRTDVVQFISYEGSFTATDGPAAGMTSTNIGVSQNSDTPTGASLSLVGQGNAYNDFTWDASVGATPGTINNGQRIECSTNIFGFKYYEGASTYSEAKEYCRVSGSTIATIVNDEDRLKASIEINGRNAPWIGLEHSFSPPSNVNFKCFFHYPLENDPSICPYPTSYKCVDFWVDQKPIFIENGGYECSAFYPNKGDGNGAVNNDIDCDVPRPVLCNAVYCQPPTI